MTEKCRTCKFFGDERTYQSTPQRDGICLRYPPTVTSRGTEFPKVKSSDGCGEWDVALDPPKKEWKPAVIITDGASQGGAGGGDPGQRFWTHGQIEAIAKAAIANAFRDLIG